jgi:hypothetical protein
MVRSNINVVTVVNAEDEDIAKNTHILRTKEVLENFEKLYPSIKLEVYLSPIATELPQEIK